MKRRLRIDRPYRPFVILILLALQILDASRIWTILLCGLGGAWVTAYVWVLAVERNLLLRRESRLGWVQVGGQIEMRFTVSNTSFLPAMWVLFEDRSTLPGYDASSSFSLGAGDFKQWNLAIPCNRRALYTFGEAELEISDPFGIYKVTIYDPAQS